MNSTEAKMQSRRQSEEDGELSDEVNWSTEEKPILTEGLRRSRRQVSFPSSSDSSSAHTHLQTHSWPAGIMLAAAMLRESPTENHQ